MGWPSGNGLIIVSAAKRERAAGKVFSVWGKAMYRERWGSGRGSSRFSCEGPLIEEEE